MTIPSVAYIRRSGDKQENSLPDQKKEVLKFVELGGYSLIQDLSRFNPKSFEEGFFIDDAISGVFADNRGGFKEMIRISQEKNCPFKAILVWDIKRFSRGDSDEAGHFRYILKQNGVDVVYISENLRGDDSDDLVVGTKQWLARQESKDTSRDVIRGMLTRIKRGYSTSGHPYGYYRHIIDKDGKVMQVCKRGEKSRSTNEDYTKLVPGDKKEIEVVRRIYVGYAYKGMGYRLIARMLNQEGLPSPRGKKWNLCAIEFILSNEVYIGNLVYNKTTKAKFHRIVNTERGFEAQYRGKVARVKTERYRDRKQWIVIEGAVEPIIEKALFYKVQELRKQRITNKSFSGKATTSNYLWSGIIRCKHCDRSMYGHYVKTPYGKNPYYSCPGCPERGVRKKSIVSATQLDALLLNRIKEKFHNSDRIRSVLRYIKNRISEQSNNRVTSIDEVNRSISEIDKRTNELLDTVDLRHRDIVNRKLDELKSQKEMLIAKRQELLNTKIDIDVDKVAEEILKNANDFEAVLKQGSPSERKEILRSYVGKIIIDTDVKQASVGFYPIPRSPATEPILLEYAPNLERRPEHTNVQQAVGSTKQNQYAPTLEQRPDVYRYPRPIARSTAR